MKKVYSKPLFRLVETEMAKRWPEFKPYKHKDKSFHPFCRIFCWNIEGLTKIFIEICVDKSGWEAFYCDFAWTSINEYPVSTMDNFPLLEPETAFGYAEIFSGIQRLWGNQGIGEFQIADPFSTFRPMDYDDPMERMLESVRRLKLQDEMTEAEGERLVAPVVADLFAKLEQYAIPFLRGYVDYLKNKSI